MSLTQPVNFRKDTAILWKQILQTDTKALFGNDSQLLLNRVGTEDGLAQPGFVGSKYKPGGLVFISMNPGNGGVDGNGLDDLSQYKVLRNLRDAQDDNLTLNFENLTGVVSGVMSNWVVVRNLVFPVLGYAGFRDLSSVAYLNLLKWRTKSSGNLKRLYDLSWTDHTSKQISLLQPSIVVALGKTVGDHFNRRRSPETQTFTIRRHFDNPRPNNGEGAADLKAIEQWFANRRVLESVQ